MSTEVAERWLRSTIEGLGLACFPGPAPRNQTYPFVRSDMMSTTDVNGVGPSARIMVENTYNIYVTRVANEWTAAHFDEADSVDEAIDGQQATVAGVGYVLAVQRQGEYRDIEQVEGSQVRSLGGRYLIQTKAL